jgi:DNA repair protein RadD
MDMGKRVVLQAPTGGGKTTVAAVQFQWALSLGLGGSFYVNRRLLIPQAYDRFTSMGLHVGIRAAGYEDLWDPSAPIQICAIDTEASRVLKRGTWDLHPSGLVIVDEGHESKGKALKKLLEGHKASTGAMIELLSATPIELSDWADEIIISGTLKEYRDCKALVPAIVKSIEHPDIDRVKRKALTNKEGEFILDANQRKIYTQHIVGSVMDRWKKYNPDARPTLLYAPGVKESIWFCEKFRAQGVNWAHVDANYALLDGQQVRLTRSVWTEIMEQFREGKIKGISNMLKLRTGIDVPEVYHCILACPIGSLASYLQAVGRTVRYSPSTPDSVLITDHGGNFWRHGSPNQDQPWEELWRMSNKEASEYHRKQREKGEEKEPIRCPRCEGERRFGLECPHKCPKCQGAKCGFCKGTGMCGFKHDISKRHVIQEDGKLIEVDGPLIKPKPAPKAPDAASLWKSEFWGHRKNAPQRTFKQLKAAFYRKHGFWPPNNLPFMPKFQDDWNRHVGKVDFKDLIGERR